MIAALTALVIKTPQWGFWMCYDALRLAGHRWNWKRVYRDYCALKLNLKRRSKRRHPPRERQPLDAPAVLNGIWALDFMSDMFYSGTRFRTLNVLDEGNRQALAVEVALSLPVARVTQLLDQLVALHDAPSALRCDIGPEFVSAELTEWCERHGVRLRHIQPGKPNQNACIERLNGSYRKEGLFSARSTISAPNPSAGSPSTTRGGRMTASAGSRRSPSCRGHPRRPSLVTNGVPSGEADGPSGAGGRPPHLPPGGETAGAETG